MQRLLLLLLGGMNYFVRQEIKMMDIMIVKVQLLQKMEWMDNYTFMEGTPFKSETQIHVGKFYAVVYFGPFRDENTVEPKTNEQIGANYIISKTGGNGFTNKQIQDLNEAKKAGKMPQGWTQRIRSQRSEPMTLRRIPEEMLLPKMKDLWGTERER